MSLPDEFPWLLPSWQRLGEYLRSARVPQALLITGPAGVGKLHLAEAFAERLLCQSPGESACGACSACALVRAQTHPDYLRISPAEPGKPITVDAIRGLVASVALRPQYGAYRVVLLAPADRMNRAAANSLLKSLEEPDDRTVMLLVSDVPDELPATILSRCQRLAIPLPADEIARSWLVSRQASGCPESMLAMARGAPLLALSLDQSGMIEQRLAFFQVWGACLEQPLQAIRVAEKWQKSPCELLVDWMSSWVVDLIRIAGDPACENLYNRDLRSELQALSRRLNSRQLFGYLDLLLGSKQALAGQINRQLALEELLIRWSQLPARPEPIRD